MPANPVQERTFARFNKISVKNPDSHDFISLETFMHYFRLAEVCNITEGCFISQINGHRYFNAGEGADPGMVATLFYCGLLQTICPSANLQEISRLPQGVYTAVKHYRTKVLKEQNRRVLLTLRSSYLDWHETEDETDCLKNYPAYHFIKIGMLRQVDVTPCTSIKEEVTSNINQLLPSLRAQSLGRIISKVRKFFKKYRPRNTKALNDEPQALGNKDKPKYCPQKKKDCKCWICQEVGHYSYECPNTKNNKTQARVLEEIMSLEYLAPIEDMLSDISSDEELYLLESDTEGNYELSDNDCSTTSDSEDQE
jgi:hypothetical protein